MTFTESDAANDGLIKREVGREMAKVAKTQNPKMFQHFERVCDEVGREPAEVFGEMCVRALDNEDYARNILNSEINMSQIRADEIRLEDIKYVKQLSEQLGLNKNEDSKDPIDKLINQRLEMVTQSPLDNLRRNRNNPEGVNGEVLDHMESLQSEISNLKRQIEEEGEAREAAEKESNTGEKSVDDLFGDVDDKDAKDNEGVNVEEGESEAEYPVYESKDIDEDEEEESEPTEEQLEEALEGTGTNVDDAWDDEETEELDPQMDIPSEDDGGDGIVTSEDGEEE